MIFYTRGWRSGYRYFMGMGFGPFIQGLRMPSFWFVLMDLLQLFKKPSALLCFVKTAPRHLILLNFWDFWGPNLINSCSNLVGLTMVHKFMNASTIAKIWSIFNLHHFSPCWNEVALVFASSPSITSMAGSSSLNGVRSSIVDWLFHSNLHD